MSDGTGNLNGRWADKRSQGGSATSKASIRNFIDCEFNVNPGGTSMQLLAAIKQHVSSTRDDVGQECTPQTYPHCIIFTYMVTDKLHRNEANLQNDQRLYDFAARLRPGYWVFVGPGSESIWEYDKWLTEDPKEHCDRKALQILQIYKACGHLDDPGTTIFEQGTLRSTLSKANIHVNKSEQSVSMICKLVESVNRLCMLLATTKYMDDLPKDTLGKAKEATRRRFDAS